MVPSCVNIEHLKGKVPVQHYKSEWLIKLTLFRVSSKFKLRDLIDTPPTLLGRWRYANVVNQKI